MNGQATLRASDADRDRTVGQLQDGCAQGRLTLEEMTERLELALSARTYGELEALTSDLPTRPAFVGTPRRWIVEVFGGGSYSGRWRMGRSVIVVGIFGAPTLDLRDAVITHSQVRVTAFALFGGVAVIVPDHCPVNMSGAALFGGRTLRIASEPLDGAPSIQVRALALFGGVEVKDKPRRRRGRRREERLPTFINGGRPSATVGQPQTRRKGLDV